IAARVCRLVAKSCIEDDAADRVIPTTKITFLDFPKKYALPPLDLGQQLIKGGVPGGGEPSVLSSVALPHAATALASKGLGPPNRLIFACDTLNPRATSASASPLASLSTASRR